MKLNNNQIRNDLSLVYIFFLLIDVDPHAVDLDAVVGADQDVFDAVDDLGADKVAALAAYLDGNVGGLDLELLGCEVDGADLRFLAKGLVEALLKGLDALLRDAAGGEDLAYGVLRYGEGLFLFRGLVLLDQLGDLGMHRLDDVHVAILGNGLAEDRLKVFLLLQRGHGNGDFRAEKRLNKGILTIGGTSGIVKRFVNIGASVLVLREHEAELGYTDRPIGTDIAEFLFIRMVAERGLGQLDGANGADEIVEDRRGFFLFLAVLGIGGDVVGIVGKEDEIGALKLHGGVDLFVKLLDGTVVGESAFAESGEQSVLVGVQNLLRGEFHINEIFSERA